MHNFYFDKNININWFILLGLFLHIVASYFTIGYFNEDEHFQIIAPLEKLLNIENTLTWEFESKIRPWIQPYFYYGIINLIDFLNINNPFTLSFILRLISSLIGFLSIIVLYNHLKLQLNLDNNFSKLLIFSFWFYAFLHSRTSSENLSISMLIFGFVLFDRFVSFENQKNKFVIAIFSGFFLGLSMILKYQIIISVFFIYVWFLFFRLNLKKLKYIIANSLLILSTLFLGLVFDYYGYGSFNNTYYKYYYANFVAKWFESFGIDPWWYYLKILIEQFFPPINIIILISLIFFWFKNLKNILTFLTLPVIITLSILSHKELRFLFPVLIFSPFFMGYFFSNTKKFFGKTFLLNLVIIFNILFMILLVIPATEQVKVYKFLYDNDVKNNKIYYYEDNPYIINDLEPKFYTNDLPNISELPLGLEYTNSYVILRDFKIYNKILEKGNCNSVFSVYPEFINKNNNWKDRKFNWYVIYCN